MADLQGFPEETMVEISFEIVVKAELADKLQAAARKRERTPASLMAEIMEIVLVDDLVEALLDDA